MIVELGEETVVGLEPFDELREYCDNEADSSIEFEEYSVADADPIVGDLGMYSVDESFVVEFGK